MKRWLVLATLAASCSKSPPKPALATLSIEVSGCAPVRCEPDDTKTLRFVVPAGPIALATDRGPLVSEQTPLGTLVRHTVRIPDGARYVSITAPNAANRLELVWSPALPALDRARALRAEGKVDDAIAALRPLLEGTGETRARALDLLARIELARGESDVAIKHLREAIALHVERRADRVDDTFALAHALVQYPRRFDEARSAIDSIDDDYPDARARKTYYLGELALETGDVRTAIASFRSARQAAERLGLRKLQRISEQYLALSLQTGGRTEDARALLDAVLTDHQLTACERADALTNLGWIALLGRESGSSLDPAGPTEQALALVRKSCPNARDEANLLVNLALAALQTNDLVRARERISDARKVLPEQNGAIAAWALEIEGRASLAAGDARTALGVFERLDKLAPSRDLAWRAAVAIGEAQETLGARKEALAAYERAESILDGLSLELPHGDGRDGFLGDRARSARFLVDLLVRMKRNDDALRVARVARTRGIAAFARSGVLSSLAAEARAKWERAVGAIRLERDAIDREAGSDWKLASDQLAAAVTARSAREARMKQTLDEALAALGRASKPSPPRPIEEGELLLAFHPVRRGFAVFAADRASVAVESFVNESMLVSAFAARLRDAKRIRVLPYGTTHSIDVHALMIDGAPLIARVPVSYSLDLPTPPSQPIGDAMLVVADPNGDLPGARAEAKEIVDKTKARSLFGDAATSVAVRAALPLSDRFHYAGHGSAAGEAGWESVLPLSQGTLGVSDVLSLPRVPSFVVLSACDSARTTAHAEGLGIAQSFVLAGSSGVIATSREVPDVTAVALAHALYGNVTPSEGTDGPSLLRSVQLSMRVSAPSSDWAAFRALTP